MSLFDKEIIINGKVVRNPEQQVYKNMKDIEKLQAKIKPIYLTSEALSSSSVSVPTADTNIGEATEGWLLTNNALLFRIDGNDGTTVLLTFASDLNGPVGPSPVITASATVGDQVGTPAVTVVKTGTDLNPTFTFNFTNLKGEPGDNLITVQVVESLPVTGTQGILYFVANNSGESQNAYDEYIYNNGNWEKLGQAQMDLSNYIQKSLTSGLVKNDGTIDTNAYITASSLIIENIKDSDGNNRFVEGNISTEAITGVTFNYAKWGLSGTHLMMVLAGEIAIGTSLTANTIIADMVLPTFIINKIYPTFGSEYLELKPLNFVDGNANVQNGRAMLRKAYGRIYIYNVDAITITDANRGFRVQFDLLIDNE